MATNFGAKSATPPLIGKLAYQNGAEWINSINSPSTLCTNLVKCGLLTPEIMALKTVTFRQCGKI